MFRLDWLFKNTFSISVYRNSHLQEYLKNYIKNHCAENSSRSLQFLALGRSHFVKSKAMKIFIFLSLCVTVALVRFSRIIVIKSWFHM